MGGRVVKLEIPPGEKKTGGPEFGLIINKTGVTDIGVQIEMVKKISAQDGMWYISDDKNKGELFA